MRVIQLNRDLVWEIVPIRVVVPESPHQVCQRTRYQEVFLQETEALAHGRRIIRIQDPCQGFRFQSLAERANEVAGAEFLKIEIVWRRGSP